MKRSLGKLTRPNSQQENCLIKAYEKRRDVWIIDWNRFPSSRWHRETRFQNASRLLLVKRRKFGFYLHSSLTGLLLFYLRILFFYHFIKKANSRWWNTTHQPHIIIHCYLNLEEQEPRWCISGSLAWNITCECRECSNRHDEIMLVAVLVLFFLFLYACNLLAL